MGEERKFEIQQPSRDSVPKGGRGGREKKRVTQS